MARVLHVISQRPGWTGSGVALDALTRAASRKNWDQFAILGTPSDDPSPTFGGLDASRIYPLTFGIPPLDFLIPGMSDVMPYPSSRFSQLSQSQLEAYRTQWAQHLAKVIEETQPNLIHSHHIWLLSSLIKDVAPEIPVVTHSHGTGLRQLELCPELADEVKRGCRRNDHFFVLHRENRIALQTLLELEGDCITTLGNGFREDIFHADDRKTNVGPVLAYAGKLSNAKGVPWLLDACDRLSQTIPDFHIHIAGSGAGPESEAILARLENAPYITFHGQVDQAGLADILRQSKVFVLPSFYEGLPLVLVEAAACGCQIVATELPGVLDPLAPLLSDSLSIVPLPRLASIDEPEEDDLPAFVDDLTSSLQESLHKPESGANRPSLEQMTWTGIFERIEQQWLHLLAK